MTLGSSRDLCMEYQCFYFRHCKLRLVAFDWQLRSSDLSRTFYEIFSSCSKLAISSEENIGTNKLKRPKLSPWLMHVDVII